MRVSNQKREATQRKAYATIEWKALDDDKRIIEGYASTPTSDRVDDIMEPEGAKFSLPMPLLWQHDSWSPVGNVVSARVTSKGIRIKAQLAIPDESTPSQLRARLEEAWWSAKHGLVRGLSIGFRGLKRAYLDNGGVQFFEWDWYELSLVTIPANQEANIISVKRYARGASGPRTAVLSQLKARRAANVRKGETMKTIGEQIAALEDERKAVAATIKELGDKELGGEELTAEEIKEFEAAEELRDGIDGKISRLKSYERNNIAGGQAKKVSGRDPGSASKSRGDDAPQRGTRVEVKKREGEEGLGFARVLKCYAFAEFARMNPADVAEQFYKDYDPRVGHFITAFNSMKAAVTGGNIGGSNWAGAVAGAQDLTTDFLTFLRARTLLGKFGMDGVPSLRRMPLNTALNGLVGGLTGFFVGESAGTPISKGAVSNQPLLPFEAAGATVISKKNLRFANIALETAIRDDLIGSLRQVEDDGFVNPTHEGTAVRPASVTFGVTALDSIGDDAASVRKDLQQLVDPLEAANMDPDEVVLLMHSRLARAASLMRTEFGGVKEFVNMTPKGGEIEGYPVLASNTVPISTVIAVHAPSIAFGDDDGIDVEADQSATVQMDGAPTQSSATPTATTGVSMRQTRSVYMQATHYVSWKKLRANCVSLIDDATWNASASV